MLVMIVAIMGVGANLPDDILAFSGVDRQYLFAGLLFVVAIALLRYTRFVLLLAVTTLAVGANLPQELAQALNVDTRFLMPTLVAIVILSLVNRAMKSPSSPEKPQEIVAEHNSIEPHEAIEGRPVEIVEPIFESAIYVDARSEQGFTALMTAASKGDEEMVQLLINKGADLNAVNAHGQTALQIARLAGHQASVDALMVAVMSEITDIRAEFDSVTANTHRVCSELL